jgi:hypothetical protein
MLKPRNPTFSGRLSLLFACALYASTAPGIERVGDTTYLYELGQYSRAATGLESELFSLIESASGNERFDLYWTCNHLTGTWVQVGLLQSQLKLSVSVPSHLDDAMARITLRDQARFVVWELDNALFDLEQKAPDVERSSHLRISEALRSLLSALRTTVSRLAAG